MFLLLVQLFIKKISANLCFPLLLLQHCIFRLLFSLLPKSRLNLHHLTFYFPWENVPSRSMWGWFFTWDPFHWLLVFFFNLFLLVTNVLTRAGTMDSIMISKYIYRQSYPSCWDALVTLSRVSPVCTLSHISLLSLENLSKYFHDYHSLSIFISPLRWCFSK